MTTSQQTPPPLPTQWTFTGQPLASKDQRIRAGLIDHFIDSTLWFWLFILIACCALQLESSLDARAFLIVLATHFPISIFIIGLMLFIDFGLCLTRGHSIGQIANGIYKTTQRQTSQAVVWRIFDIPKIWLHGLLSRCLGLPLLSICLITLLILNPNIPPINLHEYSLVEPEGAYQLMVFLLKIIISALLLFGLFLPAGVGFITSQLPTWYDNLLGVSIVEKSKKSRSKHPD